jgi:lipoate---protein ligase
MKTGTATRKIPGGKMVRVEVTYDTKIETVKITGDFFLHPEETLELIQQTLTGCHLPIRKNELIDDIENLLVEQKAEFIGASVIDLINILAEALV